MTDAAKILEQIKHLDLYLLLEAVPGATDEEIKKAYKKMAFKRHPDKNPGNPRATEDFQQLGNAYAVLKDKAARRNYDMFFEARKARKRGRRPTQSTKDDMEEDLLTRFGGLSVRHSKTWTMGDQARYKAAFKASEKESNFFDAKRDGGLGNWVGFNPSCVSKDDRIKEVIIMWPGLPEEAMHPVSKQDLGKIIEEFEQQRSKGDRSVTKEFLKNLGKKYCYTMGKWMITVDTHSGEKIWQALCKGLLDGHLPDCIISMKMKLEDLRGNADNSTKINVYTEDFNNEADVRAAENGVVEQLFRSGLPLKNIKWMKYKAEVYTHLNIFTKNKFGGNGIPPSMYTGRHAGGEGKKMNPPGYWRR